MNARTVSCGCGAQFVATGRRAAAVTPDGRRLDRCGACRRSAAAASARSRSQRLRNAQCAAVHAATTPQAPQGAGIGLSGALR